MRANELKSIIDRAVNEHRMLVFSPEPLYGGKRFSLASCADFIAALNQLIKQPWVDEVDTRVQLLIDRYNKQQDIRDIEISPEEFTALNDLVNLINLSMSVFYGTLESVTQEQEQDFVNIKIPQECTENIEDLSQFNKELQDILKLIVSYKGLQGDVRFVGFDSGTEWYVIAIQVHVALYGFMFCVKIAHEIIAMRKTWYESENERLSYKAMKRRDESSKGEKKFPTFEEHVDDLVRIKKEERIDELTKQMKGETSNNPQEMKTSLSAGLDRLIAMMEKGTEFHPSLNPPKFIEQDERGVFQLNYERLQKYLAKHKKELKQIEQRKSKKENPDEQKNTNEGGNE